MLLRNHGTLAVGATVAECFLRIYFLERACAVQVQMLAAGRASVAARLGLVRDGRRWPLVGNA